jgi:hypothetical protein
MQTGRARGGTTSESAPAVRVGDPYTGATPPDRDRGVARHGAKQGSDGPDEPVSQLDMIGAPPNETAAADIT